MEVYAKRGRSRRLTLGLAGEAAVFSQERAWAVRAGGRRGSFLAAGTGEPSPAGPWPEPAGGPLALPEPQPVPPWNEPSDFDAPLIGESEGLRLLAGLGRELETELPGARLLAGALEDGASEGEIASTRGVRARLRSRLATLYLEARGPGREAPAAAALYLAAREARRFSPAALARRLADRLAVAAAGGPPERGALDGGELLLAPPVVCRLLAGLLPLLVGPKAPALLAGLRDGRGRIGSDLVTLIDDGRLPGGFLESAVDGEGLPCREVVLVERGVFRQPLLAWWQAKGVEGVPSGCSRRPSWRDLPAPGPTHLYWRPEGRTPVASLLGAVERGVYLIDAEGAARVDLEAGRFALPVCGFAVRAGRAVAPVAGVWLCGGVGDLFRGIVGVGRDLAFQALDGMIGAPTLLATGLELRTGPG